MAIDYKDAGVDIEKGDALVDWLKKSPQQEGPHRDCIVDGIGGFASIFKPNLSGMKEPCLVSATDGVGTKLKLAIDLNRFETLGQDLVAMCANDLICTGAQPLFFLDYYATSKLDLKQAQPFLEGVRLACHQAQMALIGGETAEMPGLYKANDFDCAGFAVGIVDKTQIIGPHNVKEGMVAVGVSSSGFHSNGYSLVRKLFFTPEDLKEWGETLLKPTALYVDLALKALGGDFGVAAMAHITGGGIHNVPRVLPKGLGLKLQKWQWPTLFQEAQKRAKITAAEMLKTFNCGVGFVMIVEANQQAGLTQLIESEGFQAIPLGSIQAADEGVILPQEWNA